ncbi:MAG: hypothetical protein OHK0053_03890 [Microscillaceae bacterium]
MQDFKKWNLDTFYQWAGLEIVEFRPGYTKILLHVQAHHRGGGGPQAINGGIVAYLFDGLLGACAASVWDEDTTGQVTVALNIQYLGMLVAEKQVMGEAKVVKKGKSTVFLEGWVYDESGTLCVNCNGIFRLRHKKKQGH